uniref:Nucleoredoxin like 1 n=1 Tax=Neogobius melanostomus TaxID=47308 RepID=A0A8C6WJ94_9GOBI
MVDLFVDRVLVKNNKDQDELDTEREIVNRLQNRILLLFFGSLTCDRCQEFAPALSDFYKQLTDEFYVDRSAQLVLLYVSMDQSEEEQESFLKELPKKCLFLGVGSHLCTHPKCCGGNTAPGPRLLQNWQEAAQIIDRNFMISDDISDKSMRSLTDPIRRLKYKVENKKKQKRKGWGMRKDAEADGGGEDGGAVSPW